MLSKLTLDDHYVFHDDDRVLVNIKLTPKRKSYPRAINTREVIAGMQCYLCGGVNGLENVDGLKIQLIACRACAKTSHIHQTKHYAAPYDPTAVAKRYELYQTSALAVLTATNITHMNECKVVDPLKCPPCISIQSTYNRLKSAIERRFKVIPIIQDTVISKALYLYSEQSDSCESDLE